MASISSVRTFLYWLARLLGDLSAILRGRVGRRVARRLAGKLTGRFLGRIFGGVLLLLAAQASAEESGLTVILPEGGTIRQEGNRLDVYDAKSRRTGYGYGRPDGSWDLYHQDGSRRGMIQKGPGGEMRVTVPKGRK